MLSVDMDREARKMDAQLKQMMRQEDQQKRKARTQLERQERAKKKSERLMEFTKNSGAWLKDMKDAPTYYPTAQEFEDPMRYIQSIQAEASKYGICKIVPPHLPSHLPASVISSAGGPRWKFTTRQQTVQKQTWNSFKAPQFYQSPNTYSLKEYEIMAEEFQRSHLGSSGNLPPKMVEAAYWCQHLKGESMTVEYGNDVVGTAFDSPESEDPLAKTKWNLRVLPTVEESALRLMGIDIPGVTSPMLYIGMLFATFAWHVEDQYLYSINYQHMGAAKTWYGVPASGADGFEKVVLDKIYRQAIENEITRGSSREDAQNIALNTLLKKTTVFGPNELMKEGVPVYRAVQAPGEFIITFPRSYHGGFSNGFCVGEAVNFGFGDWFQYGLDSSLRYSRLRTKPLLAQEQLLVLEAEHIASKLEEAGENVNASVLPQFCDFLARQESLLEEMKQRGAIVKVAKGQAFRGEPCQVCEHVCYIIQIKARGKDQTCARCALSNGESLEGHTALCHFSLPKLQELARKIKESKVSGPAQNLSLDLSGLTEEKPKNPALDQSRYTSPNIEQSKEASLNLERLARNSPETSQSEDSVINAKNLPGAPSISTPNTALPLSSSRFQGNMGQKVGLKRKSEEQIPSSHSESIADTEQEGEILRDPIPVLKKPKPLTFQEQQKTSEETERLKTTENPMSEGPKIGEGQKNGEGRYAEQIPYVIRRHSDFLRQSSPHEHCLGHQGRSISFPENIDRQNFNAPYDKSSIMFPNFVRGNSQNRGKDPRFSQAENLPSFPQIQPRFREASPNQLPPQINQSQNMPDFLSNSQSFPSSRQNPETQFSKFSMPFNSSSSQPYSIGRILPAQSSFPHRSSSSQPMFSRPNQHTNKQDLDHMLEARFPWNSSQKPNLQQRNEQERSDSENRPLCVTQWLNNLREYNSGNSGIEKSQKAKSGGNSVPSEHKTAEDFHENPMWSTVKNIENREVQSPAKTSSPTKFTRLHGLDRVEFPILALRNRQGLFSPTENGVQDLTRMTGKNGLPPKGSIRQKQNSFQRSPGQDSMANLCPPQAMSPLPQICPANSQKENDTLTLQVRQNESAGNCAVRVSSNEGQPVLSPRVGTERDGRPDYWTEGIQIPEPNFGKNTCKESMDPPIPSDLCNLAGTETQSVRNLDNSAQTSKNSPSKPEVPGLERQARNSELGHDNESGSDMRPKLFETCQTDGHNRLEEKRTGEESQVTHQETHCQPPKESEVITSEVFSKRENLLLSPSKQSGSVLPPKETWFSDLDLAGAGFGRAASTRNGNAKSLLQRHGLTGSPQKKRQEKQRPIKTVPKIQKQPIPSQKIMKRLAKAK